MRRKGTRVPVGILTHTLDMVMLMETKILFMQMGHYFDLFSLIDSICVDLVGLVGRTWMLLNLGTVTINHFYTFSQCIHAIIMKNGCFQQYMPARTIHFKTSCGATGSYVDFYNVPWLVRGDLNDYGSSSKRSGYIDSMEDRRMQIFNTNVSQCNLFDLGYNRPKLTWTNNI